MTVDLAAGTATGDASVGTDHFTLVSRVRGSNFNDTISGDANNNVLDGRGGDDTLTGGGGSDQFIYNGGADTITDFNHADGDTIDLTGAGATTWAQLQSMMSQSGLDTLIDFSGGNILTLKNVTLANLTASDFVFSAFSGDLGISVNKGGTVVLTTADIHAVEPNHPASALTFTVSNPTHGYVALATDQGHAIPSFTEADLEAGNVVFVHDGSNTTQATFKVSVSDGVVSSAPTTVLATVTTVTFDVLTATGFDFQNGDPLVEMGSASAIISGTTSTQFTITSTHYKYVVDGTNFTFDGNNVVQSRHHHCDPHLHARQRAAVRDHWQHRRGGVERRDGGGSGRGSK